MPDNRSLVFPAIDVTHPLLSPRRLDEMDRDSSRYLSRISQGCEQIGRTCKHLYEITAPRTVMTGFAMGAGIGVTAGAVSSLFVSLGGAITKPGETHPGQNLVNGILGGTIILAGLGAIGGCIEALRSKPES